jgi:hypothetical protein
VLSEVPGGGRTSCNGLGPQLVILELIEIGLRKAAGLDGLERHSDVVGTAVGRGGGGEETEYLRGWGSATRSQGMMRLHVRGNQTIESHR